MIRRATTEDARFIGARLRDADWAELWASRNESPLATVVDSVWWSEESWVFECPTYGPFAIWGIGPGSDIVERNVSWGVPWMLATPHMEKHKRDLLGVSRIMTDYYHTKYELLCNYTDKRHVESHRYLQWCGFTFLREVPFGASQLPFYEFVRLADVRSN